MIQTGCKAWRQLVSQFCQKVDEYALSQQKNQSRQVSQPVTCRLHAGLRGCCIWCCSMCVAGYKRTSSAGTICSAEAPHAKLNWLEMAVQRWFRATLTSTTFRVTPCPYLKTGSAYAYFPYTSFNQQQKVLETYLACVFTLSNNQTGLRWRSDWLNLPMKTSSLRKPSWHSPKYLTLPWWIYLRLEP